ncbi:DUF368 domain-containing protein [Treponema zuelzerae]|uniref:DUF368 domain-containing protein n=1 Tax=Teretinema zuelzerae TaxID=156 RepID=A0AAE3JIA5_9SPIR|nr:DUF368 domain-containing protein [Teretinema zuelzerae]MCD1654927.1 DUF368 domain-containing protein [Teretinema zuelzerae]
MNNLKTYLVGIILGIANVIPGVSGGTMAVVFNVYDKILEVISLDFSRIKKNILFLLLLAAGLATGVLLFANLVDWLFASHPTPTAFFFTGIILGSVPFIFKRAKGDSFSPGAAVFIAAGLAVMIVMAVVQADESVSAITSLSVPVFFWLFFLGAVGAVAMIIPGISGSLVLLILGGYRTVISAISDFNIPLLLPIGFGIIAGLLAGAGLVRFLMTRFPKATYALILGLVAGSVLPVYPGLPSGIASTLISLASLIAGTALSWFFSRSESASPEAS